MAVVTNRNTAQQGPVMFTPRADVVETAHELWVYLEMPGVKPEDLEINYERGDLTVQGRCRPSQPPSGPWLVQEYEVGDFHRAFRVSQDVDGSKISAELKNGLLTLRLPKTEAARPRRITVKSE
jgi:HSP20 family protein